MIPNSLATILTEAGCNPSYPLQPVRPGLWLCIFQRKTGEEHEFDITSPEDCLDAIQIIWMRILRGETTIEMEGVEDEPTERLYLLKDRKGDILAGLDFQPKDGVVVVNEVTQAEPDSGSIVPLLAKLVKVARSKQNKTTYHSIQFMLPHGDPNIVWLQRFGFVLKEDLSLGSVYNLEINQEKERNPENV